MPSNLIKNVVNKKYLIYGCSILLTRGVEFLVLLFAAHYLVKEDYGELEYYKKFIEVGSSFFAFGFPALILSYTRSNNSKVYFFTLSLIFVLFIALISIGIFSFFNLIFLIIPFIFYAIFFNGGITPAFILVYKGSNEAAYYKMIISVIFYLTVFCSILFFNITSMAYVIVNYILLPLGILYLIILYRSFRINFNLLKKYWSHFKKLLSSSFSLVVSNFTNLMFLYTDIFIIKLVSVNSNTEIANYSFNLNIANIIMLIPFTLVQVDIEKLKSKGSYLGVLNKKIMLLTFIAIPFLIIFYLSLTNYYFEAYKDTFILFLLIMMAKTIHAFSTLYGTNLLILKLFKENLYINIGMLFLNIILSYLLYSSYNIIGVAIASIISLTIRYIILIVVNRVKNY